MIWCNHQLKKQVGVMLQRVVLGTGGFPVRVRLTGKSPDQVVADHRKQTVSGCQLKLLHSELSSTDVKDSLLTRLQSR